MVNETADVTAILFTLEVNEYLPLDKEKPERVSMLFSELATVIEIVPSFPAPPVPAVILKDTLEVVPPEYVQTASVALLVNVPSPDVFSRVTNLFDDPLFASVKETPLI
ncbi:MAG: hypothetical protein IJS13_03610 [Paludibacteraceae bacterium]|nr:hypothetical protein [Paludibacteraceae bacterium]